MIAFLICWFFGHKFENPKNSSFAKDEYYEEYERAGKPSPSHLLAFCDRCGDGPWRLT